MKKILALVLALVMLVAMVACASKDTTADKTPADTTPADTAKEDTTTEDTPAGNTTAETTGSELKVGVFYYTFADTYIASVRTALDAQLDHPRRHLPATSTATTTRPPRTSRSRPLSPTATTCWSSTWSPPALPDVANEINLHGQRHARSSSSTAPLRPTAKRAPF